MSVLLVEKSGGIATITLNRPEALNALDTVLRDAIARAFQELAKDAEVRVAILTGAGRAFSAGIDLKELSSGRIERSGAADYDMIAAIHDFGAPVIGAVNGHAITGGFELALACDLLIASENAVFADTHARVGIVPGWGLSQKLPRLIGIGRAKELSFTGNFIGAEQAERWGLVNRVVPAHELMPVCRQLAQDILSCDPPSLRRYKQMIDRGYAVTFGDAMVLEQKVSREHLAGVTAEAIAGRRVGIQDRGRQQQR
ncbi:MAG TPA: enoyl-CoA hydratase [Myxococcota bacterium]|nr:enoyl-CoA hydratase [Myxococcota bacterium]